MDSKEKTNIGWTTEELWNTLYEGREKIARQIEADGVSDDADADAANKDYEEGPQTTLCNEGLYEKAVINACLGMDENGARNPIDIVLFHLDQGALRKKNYTEADDVWKDEPYGETVPAPIASALKFGKEGMNVSWAARLMWLIVVLALNWMAWAIIG